MATVLITGASAGLGEEFAWQLAADRRDLVLVARNEARLAELAKKLRGAAGVAVEVLPADLSTSRGINLVKARLSDSERPIDFLINNAGYGTGKPFLDSGLNQQVAALNVMVRAVLELSHTAAQAMRTRNRGAILNVSSIAALLPSGAYAAHKAWVKTFSEGLASELADTRVSVTAVLPGLTRTEFHARAGINGYQKLPGFAWLEADTVVRAALLAVRRRQVIVTPGLLYGTLGQVVRVVPRRTLRSLTRRKPDIAL